MASRLLRLFDDSDTHTRGKTVALYTVLVAVNIAVWAWELPQFPVKWYDRLAYYDEVWVASSFIANTIAPISPVPPLTITSRVNRCCGAKSSSKPMR